MTQSVHVALLHQKGMPVLLESLKAAVINRELEAECATSRTEGVGWWVGLTCTAYT